MKLARYAKYIFIVLIILAFSLSSVGNTYYPLLNKILQLRLCKLNCVMLYSHSISSVGERPAPRSGPPVPTSVK